ncbi:MAG: ABC transporter permease [Trinickia sp.]
MRRQLSGPGGRRVNPGLHHLSLADVAIAAVLIVVNGAISVALSLGLGRQLALAAVRTVVQLLAVGYVLGWVFSVDRWYVVLALMMLMTIIAGFAGAARGAHGYAGQRIDSLVSIWISTWLVAAVGLFAVMRIHPWYEPQYAIPILGMILGNTLTGVSLAIERMTEELTARRDRVEMALALGATRWEAARGPARQAARAGMIPTLNQMAVVGVVSLPGMMTGQVLAGQSPLQAVRYQIVIMFLIAAASALGTVGAVLLTYRRLFSADHIFLSARLVERAARR